jgi:hypothetical protein
VTRPESLGYQALIEYGPTNPESLYLALAVGPGRTMGFRTVEPADEAPRVAENPEDMRPESGDTFSRSSYSGGEGLDRAHRADGTERDRSRYWDSRNVDVSPPRGGQPERYKLLHSASSLRSWDASNTRMPLVRLGTVLYGVIADDVQVDRTANPTAGAPTWTQEAPGGTGDILDLAALGDLLYAARSTIRQRSSGGAWSSWSDLVATRLWSAKGRIIASTGAALYEARAGVVGNSVLLYTLASGQIWNDVVDAGAAILAAASDGYVYAFVEQDGDLVLKGQTLLEGEVPTALGYSRGLVFIGTSEATTGGGQIGRFWRAVLIGLRLREAQVIRTWGDGTETRDRSPKRIIATREAVWTAVIEDGSETHLWRYHLATGGISRDLILGASGRVEGLAVFDDRMFANVFGSALWRENTTYATTGYLISSLADFYNAAKKVWVGARLQTHTMPASTQIDLAYSTDPAALTNSAHSSWTTIVTATNGSPGAGDEAAIVNVQGRYATLKVTLTPNGGLTATPEGMAFEIRGLPLPTETDYILPVNISDQLERPGRRAQRIKGRGDAVHEALTDLVGRAATITILRPDEVVKGQIKAVSTPIQSIPERGSPEVYCEVVVRGQRQ